jgi:hypothetical protein
VLHCSFQHMVTMLEKWKCACNPRSTPVAYTMYIRQMLSLLFLYFIVFHLPQIQIYRHKADGTTYLLIPWCIIFFEKLMIVHLSNNSLLSLWKPKVRYRANKSPPPEPILSQPNTVCPIDFHFPKVHLNVSLPPPSGLLPSGLSTKTL